LPGRREATAGHHFPQRPSRKRTIAGRRPPQQPRQLRLAVAERQRPQILAVELQETERVYRVRGPVSIALWTGAGLTISAILAAIAVAVNWQMRIVDSVNGIDFDKVGLHRWLVDHEIATPERGPDTAGCHHFSSRLRMYGFHFIGVTVCSVPLLESIQPAAVRRHGYGSRYHLPWRPSRTNSVTSSPTGAVSRERQSYLSARTIMSKSAGAPLFCAPMAPAAWQTLPQFASLRRL
jgi:hypothetical protein